MSWLWGKTSSESPVSLLLQRLRTCTTLNDKREALLHLTEQPPSELLQIGGDGLVLVLQPLSENLGDQECVKRLLELLLVVTEKPHSTFRDIFIQAEVKGPNLLLVLLRSADFYIRFPAVQLLTRLLEHNSESVIQQILTEPNGVASLVDVLDDPRESVRNEGLLLLKALVSHNGEMRKLVSFTNALEKLFRTITDEGGPGGNIVVVDCLEVISNVVSDDVALRSFREMRCGCCYCSLVGRFP